MTETTGTINWRDMDSAPLDGTMVLLYLPVSIRSNDVDGYAPWNTTHVVLGWWTGSCWNCCFMEEGSADSGGRSSNFYMTVRPEKWAAVNLPS